MCVLFTLPVVSVLASSGHRLALGEGLTTSRITELATDSERPLHGSTPPCPKQVGRHGLVDHLSPSTPTTGTGTPT